MTHRTPSTDELAAQLQKAFETKYAQYGPNFHNAVTVILPGVPKGCSWGFITRAQARQIRLDGAKVNQGLPEGTYVAPVGSGDYLVITDFNMAVQVINSLGVPLITPENLQKAAESRASSVVSLRNRLMGIKGKKQVPQAQSLRIGIFGLNDSDTITYEGTVYPCYKADLKDLVAAAEEAGYSILIDGRPISPSVVLQNAVPAIAKFPMAPSGNALIVDLQKA